MNRQDGSVRETEEQGVIVIKIGGGAAIGEGEFRNFAADLKELLDAGRSAIVVHGANAAFSQLSRQLDLPPVMVTSSSGRISRYTDSATMDAMLMTYCGKVNKTIVGIMQAAGVDAVGLSGLDGAIASGRRKPMLRGTVGGKARVFRDDHAGTIARVDVRLVRLLLDNGYVPVLTPPALGEEGVPINVDGDKLALALAAEFGAEALLFFSDTPGLLRDIGDEASLVQEIEAASPDAALAAASGRMVVKVEAALAAIERGVGEVVFSDARAEQPVSRALRGEGTVVRRLATSAPSRV
jgi:acetylglutamate/LysW-gamma-L-alpha-aminoadipate kinase